MHIIDVCKKCGKDYMYHVNDYQFEDMCQDCYEKEQKKKEMPDG